MENADKRTLSQLYGSDESQNEIIKSIKKSKHNGILTYLFNELNSLRAEFVARTHEIDSKVVDVQT